MNDSEPGLVGTEFVVKLFRRGEGDVGIQDVRRGGVPPTTFPGDVHASTITLSSSLEEWVNYLLP
jgi:hypothetical protein